MGNTIILEHFREDFYANGESEINQVSSRNPLEAETTESVDGFQFFDCAYIKLEDGEIIFGRDKNKSCRFYFGTRYSIKKINEKGFSNIYKRMKENNYESVIITRNGVQIYNPSNNMITIGEYMEELKKMENEFMNKKDFSPKH